MVLLLRNIPSGNTFVLGSGMTYTLGRSRRNHILLKSFRASKTHATLTIRHGEVFIKDSNSTSKTWINENLLDNSLRLKHKDSIFFGDKDCHYVFLDIPTDIQIEVENLNLTTALRNLNYRYSYEYSETSIFYVTTFVSLESLKKTAILHYLIDKKLVVTPDYFIDIEKNIREAPVMPNKYRYMPQIDLYFKEKGIDDINPEAQRSTLFNNVLFIFLNKEDCLGIGVFIRKCYGEIIIYDGDSLFIERLSDQYMPYHYVVVGASDNLKKVSQFVTFLKASQLKVHEITVEDIYISMLKGALVGVNFDNRPSHKGRKNHETISLNSDDETPEGITSNDLNTRTRSNTGCCATKVKDASIKRKKNAEEKLESDSMRNCGLSPIKKKKSEQLKMPRWFSKQQKPLSDQHQEKRKPQEKSLNKHLIADLEREERVINPVVEGRKSSKSGTKIALRVESEEQMLELDKVAKELGVLSCIIRDAGQTQVAPGTRTVISIGPAPKSVLEKITGHLKLY